MADFVLASASPRRRELLSEILDEFLISPAEIDESIYSILPPKEMSEILSKKKAQKIANKYFDKYVIGADTIVCLGNKVFGKPVDEDDARKMLKFLSNKTHTVITGITLLNNKKKISETFSVESKVTFFQLSDELIDNWLKNFYFMDKAGAYAIQDFAKLFVKSINGDYFNVIGFPVATFYNKYKDLFRGC